MENDKLNALLHSQTEQLALLKQIQETLQAHTAALEKTEEALKSTYQRQQESFEAVQQAHLLLIEEQAQRLKDYRALLPSEWLKALLKVKLGVFHQYKPMKYQAPKYYTENLNLSHSPTISIVTPSYNQGHFIEKTILSIANQHYPAVQHIVQDGDSNDQTKMILEKYHSTLTHWESKKDNGQSNAINLGFRHATGDILAYLNSDDILLPGSLHYIADYFAKHPKVDVVYGHRLVIDDYDQEIGRWVLPPHQSNILSWADYIPQETLFWRRRIWEKIGGRIDENFRFAMDWDLLLRFREAGAKFVRLPRFLGGFRVHSHQKTSSEISNIGANEMEILRMRCLGRNVTMREIKRRLRPYLLQHAIYHKLYRMGVLKY